MNRAFLDVLTILSAVSLGYFAVKSLEVFFGEQFRQEMHELRENRRGLRWWQIRK